MSLISTITGISVAGVTIGVAALIVVLSVMNGFFEVVRDLLVSFDPHIRIESSEVEGLAEYEEMVRELDEFPEVSSVAPYVQGKALLRRMDGIQNDDVNKVVVVKGLVEDTSAVRNQFVKSISFGSFDLSKSNGKSGIVVGSGLANRLSFFPPMGDSEASVVSLISAKGIHRMYTGSFGFPPLNNFEVRGLLELGDVYNESFVFVSLDRAQRLFGMSDRISGIDVRLHDIETTDAVLSEVKSRFISNGVKVMSWYEIQKSLYDVMRLEKWGASLVMMLIIIVAAFNIVGSLMMIVIEKKRDLGVLRAMGMSRKDIRDIFITEGFLIAAAGSLAGVVLGLGIVLVQKYFELVKIQGSDSFIISAYPVSIDYLDITLIVLSVFVLCVLASIYPSMRASALNPAEAVRNE